MSRAYDAGDHRTLDQIREDLFPEFDDAGEPYDPVMWERAWAPYETNQFPSVYGVTAVRATASVDTRPPLSSDPPPNPSEPAAAQLLDDVHG